MAKSTRRRGGRPSPSAPKAKSAPPSDRIAPVRRQRRGAVFGVIGAIAAVGAIVSWRATRGQERAGARTGADVAGALDSGSSAAAAPGGPTVPAWFPAAVSTAGYAGAVACGTCHQAEYAKWRQSPHGRAMAVPSPESIIGVFDGKAVELPDGRAVPMRDGDRYVIDVQHGTSRERMAVDLVLASGRQHQLLVNRGGDGTLRLLPIWWSTVSDRWRPLEAAHRPGALDPGSPRHWAASGMPELNCLTCHLSGARHRIAANAIETTWRDLAIDCESCHGPGQAHVDARRGVAGGGAMRDLATLDKVAEGRLCAQCHALKFAGRFDDHVATVIPATLALDDFRVDSSQHSTSYQWAGHSVSECHRRGAAKCSSCHEPHAQTARDHMGGDATGARSDAQCTVCHRDRIDAAAARAHSHHGAAVQCVDCHMALAWLGDDPGGEQRVSDHSIAIPRAKESERFGTPDPCRTCHAAAMPAWSLAAAERWGWKQAGGVRPWVEAIDLGRRRAPGAAAALTAILADATSGDYLTASALELIAGLPADANLVPSLRRFVDSEEPLLRGHALLALAVHDPRGGWLERGLADPHAFVRLHLFFSPLVPGPRTAAAVQRAARDLLDVSPAPPVQMITDLARIEWEAGRTDGAFALIDVARQIAAPAQATRLDQLRAGMTQQRGGR